VQHSWAKNDVCIRCLLARHGYQGGGSGRLVYVTVDGERRHVAGDCQGRAGGEEEQRWVRCDERMPSSGEMVQFHVPGFPERARFVGYYSERFERFEDLTDTDRDGEPREHYDATHWRPLPAPPSPTPGGEKEGANG
jgi:hypothetical protein